ncbi:twin-arginine translocation signal domain-containing protein, partial [Akkermansiaceae bacterium]|nr:twin-arginine translocation signal domain-containing protein [Akkermansiaceae bacterium]
MNEAENISPFGQRLLNRRHFLKNTAGTLGGLGLAQLLAAKEDPTAFSGKLPIRPDIDPNNP